MAMKLNAVEKANDSIIRQYNKQIEKSVRQLGFNNTITQNLINTATQIFGSNSMKAMKVKIGFSQNQINENTGEIIGIPQISRTRATLSQTAKAKELRATTQYTRGELKGNYKSLYNVTKAYQKSIRLATQKIRANLPQNIIEQSKTNPNVVNEYINANLTNEAIQNQTNYDDLASEIFEAYEELKDLGDDTEEFEKFAHFYHDERNNYSDDALLNFIKEKRDELLRYKSKDERDEDNYFAARDALGNLDEYEDIL
jgi:hypothetical protein